VTRAIATTTFLVMLAPAICVSAQTAAPQPAAPEAAAPQAPAPEQQGFAYNPEGRRDPFVSLLRRGSELTRDANATRPAGLPGLSASEVTLSGIVASREGFVAMLQGVDKKTYIVRSGDKLLDGTVRAITADTMVIVQQVNDPLSLERQREVRKVLRQEEAN
jgi:Tfp pilus assembly protein PilP